MGEKNSRRRSSSSRDKKPPPHSNKVQGYIESGSSSKETEHDQVFNAFVVGRSVGIDTDISTMNLLLAAAALITILFAVRQVFLYCTSNNSEWIELKDPHV